MGLAQKYYEEGWDQASAEWAQKYHKVEAERDALAQKQVEGIRNLIAACRRQGLADDVIRQMLQAFGLSAEEAQEHMNRDGNAAV